MESRARTVPTDVQAQRRYGDHGCAGFSLGDGLLLLWVLGLLLQATCRFDASGLCSPDGSQAVDTGASEGDASSHGDALVDAGADAWVDAGPVCGDGIRQEPEECDGLDLGSQSCGALGYDGGDIGCTQDCHLDPSGCVNVPPWPCHRVVTVDHSDSLETLTDYTVRVDIPYAPAMQTDFSDVRFGDQTLSVMYPYWLESIVPGLSAVAWVRLPLIPGGAGTQIYLHYGNSQAVDEGDPRAVFEFFEDFEGGSLGQFVSPESMDGWEIATDQARSGTCSLARQQATDGMDHHLLAVGLDLADLSFEAWWRLSATNVDIAQLVRGSTVGGMNEYETNLEGAQGWDIAEKQNGSWWEVVPNESTPVDNTWFQVTVQIVGSRLRVMVDGVQVVPSSGWHDMGGRLGSGTVGFRAWQVPSGVTWWIDDVRVRKAADPEPRASVGSEVCFVLP